MSEQQQSHYMSFLVCKHGSRCFIYVNGLPLGYVEAGQFVAETKTIPPIEPAMRLTGTGQSFGTLASMLLEIASAIEQITL
jgi:hypothetical protein